MALIWRFNGWQFAAISTAGGLTMMILVTAWHRRAPESLEGFTYRLNAMIGGPPGEAWRWKRRTRGLILLAIGLVGIPSGLHVMSEPGDFIGGAIGAGVFTGVAAVALVVGVLLATEREDGRAGAE